METTISIIAISISVLSLVIAIYTTFKDRSRIIATSVVTYDQLNDSRSLLIEIVNAGRRPAFIKHIIRKHKKSYFLQSIESINVTGLSLEDVVNQKYKVPIVKLNEGEYYRIAINKDEMSTLYITQIDSFAENLLLEDVLGKRYKIKKIKKSIKEFLEAGDNS